MSPCNEIFPDYHPDLFVNRASELADVSNWLNTNDPNSYIKIIAAPALFGKTWFIAHLCHTLDRIQFTPLIFLPENLQTEENISDILTQALHTNECDGMYYGSLSGRLVALRECINNQNKRLLLLIDFNLLGPGDPETPKALKEFLAQFPMINQSAKIIIATRYGTVAERRWRRQFKIFPQVLELPRLLGINSLDCNRLDMSNEYCEYAMKVAKSNIDEWGSREVSEILATGERDASDVINIWKKAGVLEPGTATGTHKFVDGWRDVFRDSLERISALENLVSHGFEDLKQGQSVIYRQIDKAHQSEIKHILTTLEQGQIEQNQMRLTLDAVRRALRAAQTYGLPIDADSRKYLEQTAKAVDSHLGLERKFELALPILPFLVYKVELGVGNSVDLNAVADELRQRWQALLKKS